MGYLKAKSAVVVEMDDGRHITIDPGESVDEEKLAQHVRDRLGSDDYLDRLFEPGDEPEEEEVNPKAGDPRGYTEKVVEDLTVERAALPMQDRLGSADAVPSQVDENRTLPTSGADLPADEGFALLEGADTSEPGADATPEPGDPPTASDAPRPAEGVGEGSESGNPKSSRRSRRSKAAPAEEPASE